MITRNYLTAEQRTTLKAIVRKPTMLHGVGQRANALLLLDRGMNCEDVGDVLFLHGGTVRGWYHDYQDTGLTRLMNFGWKGSESHLTEGQKAELSVYLDENWHGDSSGIIAHISETYGQNYTPSGCTKLLHSLDFEYKKPQQVAPGADEAGQRVFVNRYEALQNALAVMNAAFYFSDAVHPEHQSRPAYGWFRKGKKVAVRCNSGRQRVNIQAALNLENFHCPFVEVETVNADSTIALFEKIEAQNTGMSRIFIALDNAKYHHAIKVRDWLERTKSKITLVFLPPYAPHLNPIERLWAVMHKKVTHNKHYATFKEFADAILNFFRETLPNEWTDFCGQVTDNFRIKSNENISVIG
jgi:transposase